MAYDPEMAEILEVFLLESTEGLGVMESSLLNIGTDPRPDTVDAIFRAAHSIKGGAGTFGLERISEFMHEVEALLDEMRNGARKVTPEAIQLLLQAVDVTRDMIAMARARQPIGTAKSRELSDKLSALRRLPVSPVPVDALPPPVSDPAPGACAEGGSGWRIRFEPHAGVLKTCNDPLRLFGQLETLGSLRVSARYERLPALADLDPTACYLGWTLELTGTASRRELTEIFDWVAEDSVITFEPLATPARLPAQVAERTPAAPLPLPAGSAMPAAAPYAAAKPPAARGADAPKASVEAGSIRVATDKVDSLINLVGELVITQSLLARFAEPFDPCELERLRRGLEHLARNTRELQESVLKIRMLPLSFSFNRFPRLVHELSRKLGKKVELRLNGQGTELDRTVLEKIGDPLVHLVRNSLDHGLETPENRLRAGKPEVGVLELNAYHQGGSVIIEVRDDGTGLDQERILDKARQRGLVATDAALTPDQVNELIFMPGFSTADAVSEVSGRGVGMDVVRRNIAELGGHVQINSTPGQGSLIRVSLPLTLAILEGQMLRVGAETYVISLVSIVETVQPQPGRIHAIAGRTELFKHRDAYLPIIRLHDEFRIVPDSREVHEGLLVIVESDGRRAAILIDELLAQQQVVVKSLETNFKHVPGLAGATIHGDGRVALILDAPGLIAKFFKGAHAAPDLAA